jgi:hypothetical protein
MIVTNPEFEEIIADVKRQYEDNSQEDPESSFYVERSTGYIYEVKLFPEYAIIRPATPEASANIMREDLVKFAQAFTEYLGDHQAIRDYLWGAGSPENIVIDRKK